MKGRVLIVAGSDSCGGAGLQADLKTVTALGGYAATAVTAITVQDTRGVSDIHVLAPELVAAQMRAVLEDMGADCIKIGMLGSAEVLEAVAQVMDQLGPDIPLVLDPVLRATGGEALLATDALSLLRDRLVARALVVTPNLSEASALTGLKVDDIDSMKAAGEGLMATGCGAVLVTGGHLPGPGLADVLVDSSGSQTFNLERVAGAETHGTGCTLASAIACGLAQGLALRPAIEGAHVYIRRAILGARGLGRGSRLLDHGAKR